MQNFVLDEENKRKILKGLQTEKYASFEADELTDELKDEIKKWLETEQIYVYQYHRHRSNRQLWFIAFKEAVIDEKLFRLYGSNQDFLGKFIPFVLSLLMILITVILFQYGDTYGNLSRFERGLMTSTAILLVPFCIGLITEYFASLGEPNLSAWRMGGASVAAWLMVLFFSVVVLREGVICLVILGPLLFTALIAGSGTMQFICAYLWRPTAKIYTLSFLPLLLSFLLPDYSQHHYGQTQREIIIKAPVENVFQAINQIGHIAPEEVPNSFIFKMGFPKPIFGMTEQRADAMVRTIQWERGVKFEERVLANHPPYLLSWNYQFTPDSFPKGSLDDHVEVGGKYFDLLKTDYQLEKIDEQSTKLILSIDYRVSTEFNWYSKLWADYILSEFSDVVMTIHKNRLENGQYPLSGVR